MNRKLVNLTYGALLHDIGKVVYRGSSGRAMHSKLGADFIKEMRLDASRPELETAYNDDIVEQIHYHHAKALDGSSTADDSLAWITYFADNISAGMDRRDLDDEEGDDDEVGAKVREDDAGAGEGAGACGDAGDGAGACGDAGDGEGAGEGVDGSTQASATDATHFSTSTQKWDRAANLQKIFNILKCRDDNSTRANDDNSTLANDYDSTLANDNDKALSKTLDKALDKTLSKTLAHEDYNALRQRVKEGLQSISVSQKGIGSLLNLLEATCDKIPSSTNTEQLIDVSLFDHSKTTAGIAACLYLWLTEQQITNYKQALFSKTESSKYYNEEIFLLWSCDISGIQSFIYNISGEGALKQLRARSFYLEMMLEHIADELLSRLKLSRCNLLYTGGGHAYMLLPNTEAVKEAVEKYEQELKTCMLKQFRTDLYVACAWVPCSAEDLANDNLCNNGADSKRHRGLFRQLSERLSAKKSNRYTAEELRQLNFSEATGDHSRECKECHRSDLHMSESGICRQCESLAVVSSALVRNDVFVVSGKDALSGEKSGAQDAKLELPFDKWLSTYSVKDYIEKFGVDANAAKRHSELDSESQDAGVEIAGQARNDNLASMEIAGQARNDKAARNDNPERHSELDSESQAAGVEIAGQARNDKGDSSSLSYRVYTKNRWDTGLNLATHLWMGDYTASTWDATSKEYAGISAYAKSGVTLTQKNADNAEDAKDAATKQPLGINRLAVLRADVDNLGTIFTSGLPDSKVSISRTATLSRQLSLFFKYELNNILANRPLGFVPQGGLKQDSGQDNKHQLRHCGLDPQSPDSQLEILSQAQNDVQARNDAITQQKVSGEYYKAQIIYSGGDDLFIIGNWSDVLHAAMDIRKALDEVTGNNALTISAGIGMYDASYPIARMAEEVGRLEDAAKNYPLCKENVTDNAGALNASSKLAKPPKLPTKNAIALWTINAVFSWDEFINSVYGKLGDIKAVFDSNEKGRAFIYKLISLLRSAKQDTISIPRLAYLLARSFQDVKDGRQTSEKFYKWATDDREREYLVAALEWYVYSIREKG
ncbi:MAG: type III-A CRISPR-associated protein Cas10/Csm1 [Coriobacteriales bacterium]|jgi:CRISPR-associated protein Cas10/Csm1 subtype III-A|nr:type III-A CRISPR-associated protein Cas10/Csm1 [Coriobacteriales bacterium]